MISSAAWTRLLAALLLLGCSNEAKVDLLIDVRTDLVVGVEFTRVRIERFDEIPSPDTLANASHVRERPARTDEPFGLGVRAAEFTGLRPGNHIVRARLVDSQNAIVLERVAILSLRRTSVFTLLMTRDCRGKTCPGPDDDRSFIACVGGRCVPPQCTPETLESCPSFSCEVGVNCLAAAACAQPVCVESGPCLRIGDSTACGPGSFCDPDSGCQRLDAEPDAGVADGSLDAGPPPPGPASGAFRAIGAALGDRGFAGGVAIDDYGNTFATGLFSGTVDFGGGALTAQDSLGTQASDLFLVSYDRSGGHRWSMSFGADSAPDAGRDVSLDSEGNVVVIGNISGTVDLGGDPLTGGWFAASFDNASGSHRWSQAFADGFPSTVGRDAANNLFIAGNFSGTVDFGGGPLTSGGGQDGFVLALSETGTFRWAERFGADGGDTLVDLAVDATGAVWVTGAFSNTVTVGATMLTSAGLQDVFVARLDSEGVPLWARGLGGVDADLGQGIATDSTGNAWVVGRFRMTVDFGAGPVTSAGQSDVFVLKLNDAGNHVFSQRFGDGLSEVAYAVAVDSEDNVVVTGEFLGAIDFGGGPLLSAGLSDIFVASFSSGGTPRWSTRYGGTGDDRGFRIGIGRSGQVAVSGEFQDTVDFGGGPVAAQSFSNIFILLI